MSDSDIAAWQQFADADGSGSVRWNEFAALEHDLLNLLHSHADEWTHGYDDHGRGGGEGSGEGGHVLHHVHTGRAFTLDLTTGSTAWVPTPKERRAQKRQDAQVAQEMRRGPPLVVRVVDFNEDEEHDVMGVAVVSMRMCLSY